MKIHFLCKWWLFCKEFIRFTFIFIFLFIFISFSLIFIRKFCKFYKKTYFIKKYKRHFIVKWKNHSVMKSFRFSQQSKSSFLYIISHNQKLLSSPHWNLSLCINLIIPFSFSPLKLISPAGLRFRSARCARGVYVYPKFGHIVLRSMIIIPEFRAQKSRPFSFLRDVVCTVRASRRIARGDRQYPCGTMYARVCTYIGTLFFLSWFSIASSSFFSFWFPFMSLVLLP